MRARATSMESLARARSLAARVSASGSRDVESAPRDATSSSSDTSRSVAGDLVSVALPSLVAIRGERRCDAPQRRRRRAPLRGRRAGRARRAPLLVVSRVDDRGGTPQRISGGDRPPPERSDALLAGEGDDLVAYVRSLRAVMAVGIPPLPGTRGAGFASDGSVAHHSAAWLIPPRRETRRRDPPRHPLAARRRVHPVRHLHAPGSSHVALAADARVLSVEYPLAPDRGYFDALPATDASMARRRRRRGRRSARRRRGWRLGGRTPRARARARASARRTTRVGSIGFVT